MKRRVLPLLALAALVVGLVYLNLSLRGAPEPASPGRARPSRQAASPGLAARLRAGGEGGGEEAAAAGARPAADRAPDGEAVLVDEPGVDVEPAAGGSPSAEADGEPAAGAEAAPPTGSPRAPAFGASGCEHPFVNTERGEWRRYRWSQSGIDEVAELRIEPVGVRADDAERLVDWTVRLSNSADDSVLADTPLTTRCAPGSGAEEPWFGILEMAYRHRPAEAPERWRIPARLAENARFSGTAVFAPSRDVAHAPGGVNGPQMLRVTRAHLVTGRESVQVPAGRFDAWRIEYEERHAFGERGEVATGTLWLAPRLGLIKSRAENAAGVVLTVELTGASSIH